MGRLDVPHIVDSDAGEEISADEAKSLAAKKQRPRSLSKTSCWSVGASLKAVAASLRNLGINTDPDTGKRRPLFTKRRKQHGHILPDEVESLNVIEFANHVLRISFEKRPAQELVLRLMYGLPLPEGQCEIYVEQPPMDGGLRLVPRRMTWMQLHELITGDKEIFEPGVEKSELVACVGRRGGKSLTSAIIILYESTRSKYRQFVREGEEAWAVLIATRQQQAERVLLRMCMDLIKGANYHFKYYMDETRAIRNMIPFRNGYRIAAYPCSSTAALGLATFVNAFDELAYYHVNGVKSDKEVVNALRPAMSQFSACNPKLLMISTPGGKQGLFWDRFSAHKEKHIPGRLVIHAPSWVFNPPGAYDPLYMELRKAYRDDPDAFDLYFRANFAEMMDAFFDPADVDATAVLTGDLPPAPGNLYFWGADQHGLSGNDRFGFCVGHKDVRQGTIVLDCVRSWDSKDADAILAEIKGLKLRYRLTKGMIDKYAKGWVQHLLQKLGLVVDIRPSLPECYNNFKTLMIGRKLEIPQRQSLVTGLKRTQAYYNKSNSLSIGHERDADGHADEADGAVTCTMMVSQGGYYHMDLTEEDKRAAAETRRREEEYDPLNYALV